jgi:hypothetical protein
MNHIWRTLTDVRSLLNLGLGTLYSLLWSLTPSGHLHTSPLLFHMMFSPACGPSTLHTPNTFLNIKTDIRSYFLPSDYKYPTFKLFWFKSRFPPSLERHMATENFLSCSTAIGRGWTMAVFFQRRLCYLFSIVSTAQITHLDTTPIHLFTLSTQLLRYFRREPNGCPKT